jgi:hypothetical protein
MAAHEKIHWSQAEEINNMAAKFPRGTVSRKWMNLLESGAGKFFYCGRLTLRCEPINFRTRLKRAASPILG